MFQNFNPFTATTSFAQSAIAAAERAADANLQFVPAEYRKVAQSFNDSWFSIARTNAEAASRAISQLQTVFAK